MAGSVEKVTSGCKEMTCIEWCNERHKNVDITQSEVDPVGECVMWCVLFSWLFGWPLQNGQECSPQARTLESYTRHLQKS